MNEIPEGQWQTIFIEVIETWIKRGGKVVRQTWSSDKRRLLWEEDTAFDEVPVVRYNPWADSTRKNPENTDVGAPKSAQEKRK